MDHFLNPRNVGDIEQPDALFLLQVPKCGITVRMTMLASEGKIRKLCFKAQGSVAVLAAASCMTEMAVGRTFGEAKALSLKALLSELGGLPENKVTCAKTVWDCFQSVVDRCRAKLVAGA